ncbi:MAG: DUF5317 domain-containing protein [Eubacteriales bacterium]|jgi:hypothetical protein
MILLFFALMGILIAALLNFFHGRKNRYQNLAEIRGLWLPVLGLALELPFTLFPAYAAKAGSIFTIASYLCIFAFLFLNRQKRIPVSLIGLGAFCNFFVIACNGWRMPVSVRALSVYPDITAEAVYAKKANYFVALQGANFSFLSDVIYVPIPRIGGFISIGDILLGLGTACFIVQTLADKLNNKHPESFV